MNAQVPAADSLLALSRSPRESGHAAVQVLSSSSSKPSRPPASSNQDTNNNAMESAAPLARQGSEKSSSELTAEQRERAAIFESSSELQELCRDNGLSATQFARRGASVAALDMFLGFWASMKSVMYFPALRELSIIKHPTITALEGIDHCRSLEVLCVTECSLERIANLAQCTRLRTLNLSSNRIQCIEGLETLTQLEVLWLHDNQLESLRGLWSLTQLKQLWASRNRIERLESALSCCSSLTELNLADNRLCSFKSLLSLTNLEHLSVLTLSDPHFGDNPVCRLCNYQTYLMCHLSRLTHLDTVELSVRNKQIADATMIKKKMYYNMRIKAIKRDTRARIKHADATRSLAEQHIERRLAALVREKKEIERYVAELTVLRRDGDTNAATECQAMQELTKKLASINACLATKYSAIYRMNYECSRVRTALQATSDINIARLMLELETGGNIRLEDGKPSDAWFVSCVDLVRSRLFASDLSVFGVQDVRITRVTRINNRYLRHRFHARMDELVSVPETQLKDNVSKKGVTVPVRDPEDPVSSSNSSSSSHDKPAGERPRTSDRLTEPPGVADSAASLESALEYLFYVQPPHFDYQRRPHELEQFVVAESGFRDPSEYARMGVDGAIKLSNSVALLEAPRLATALAVKGKLLQQQQTAPSDLYRLAHQPIQRQRELTKDMRAALQLAVTGDWDLPSGVLLVVKVFPGYSKVVSPERAPATAAAAASVKTDNVHARDFPGLQSVQMPCAPPPTPLLAASSPTTDPTTAKQKFYYVFDKALVLPEYLVEYQYTLAGAAAANSRTDALSPLAPAQAVDALKSPRSAASGLDTDATDLGVATKLADDFERRYRIRRSPSAGPNDAPSDEDDTVARVLQMEPLLPAPAGTTDASQVVTARLGAAALHHVKHLNLLGCNLESIPDLSAVSDQLEVLVLSYNNITNINHALSGLSKLRSLDLSFNQLDRLEHLDGCSALASLEVNHNALESFEDVAYLGRTFRGRALAHVDLRKNALCTTKRYRLHVLQHLPALARLDQQAVTTDESLAAQQLVTKLSAAKVWDVFYHTHAAAVPAPAPLAHDATVTATATLSVGQPCWHALEELALNRELVREIEGFELATNLRVATFADNVIARIGGLAHCTKLEELSLEDNEITQIEHLEALVALKKLHLGRNRIRVIERLDALENLTQLSLEENEISSLRGLGAALKLMELYIGHNRIDVLKEIQHLKTLPKLTILDLSGNDVTRLADYRLYAVYYLRRVKVLDGASISPQDQSDAKQKYSGKLTIEFIVEKCSSGGSGAHASASGAALERIQDMDLSSCRIREIGSIPGRVFLNVRELNLENNQISDISGLETLPKLRVLNLSRNRIDKLVPTSSAATFTVPDELEGRGILACLHLEHLDLAYNQIHDMTMLGLQFLDDLKVLHLQGNAIVLVAGLDSNTELQELHLDKNRIRQLDPNATVALRQLRILTIEDNGLKSLSNLSNLPRLELLDLSNNRLVDLDEVERLASLTSLVDLRLVNNPLTKKHLYRQSVLYKLSGLKSLDGREVTADERERVAVLFVHERAAAMASSPAAYASNSSSSSSSTSDRFIETRSYGSANVPIALTPSSIPSKSATVSAAANVRATIPQLSTGEVLSGSLLRKHPLASATAAQSQNQVSQQQQQLPIQSVSSFPKPDHTIDPGIAIAPSNTTTRSLLVHSQAVSYRNPNSLTNQASAMFAGPASSSAGGAGASLASALTSPSVFSGAFANGLPTDHFHLGGLRSDRRRMSSVHYDQSFSAVQVGSGSPFGGSSTIGLSIDRSGSELKPPVGIVSSLAVIRGPTSLSGQGKRKPLVLCKPLEMAASPSSTVAAAANTRVFASFAAASSLVGPKRYSSYQDYQPDATIPTSKTQTNQARHR